MLDARVVCGPWRGKSPCSRGRFGTESTSLATNLRRDGTETARALLSASGSTMNDVLHLKARVTEATAAS